MAANNSMLMHPAAAALNGAARLAHRGAQPKLMADAADTFLVFNAWMDKEQGFGPNGEVGILEEEVSSVLANAVRPGGGAVDAAGNSPGVFTHGLDAARWQLGEWRAYRGDRGDRGGNGGDCSSNRVDWISNRPTNSKQCLSNP